MLLGVHMFRSKGGPEEFAAWLEQSGYRAGYLPYEWKIRPGMTNEIGEVISAFKKHNIVLAEVGAWRNPFDPDPVKAKENIDYIIERLTLADEVNARCTVNVIGSPSGHNEDPANVSKEFYEHAIEVYRKIVDAVKPRMTKMCFELLPFNFLDSAEMYVQFIHDLDRQKYAGVHLDPFNVIVSPRLYYRSAEVFCDCVRHLAPLGVISIHLKDLLMHSHLPNTFIEEVPLGTGGVDIKAFLSAVDQYLPKDIPVMLEHLFTEEQFAHARDKVRMICSELGINL
jgi:sugar phosphate isomerase/epimerase